jgi:hypothetical protein
MIRECTTPTWSDWIESGDCDKPCGGGRKRYTRSCQAPEGGQCPADQWGLSEEKYEDCNLQPCIYGGWSVPNEDPSLGLCDYNITLQCNNPYPDPNITGYQCGDAKNQLTKTIKMTCNTKHLSGYWKSDTNIFMVDSNGVPNDWGQLVFLFSSKSAVEFGGLYYYTRMPHLPNIQVNGQFASDPTYPDNGYFTETASVGRMFGLALMDKSRNPKINIALPFDAINSSGTYIPNRTISCSKLITSGTPARQKLWNQRIVGRWASIGGIYTSGVNFQQHNITINATSNIDIAGSYYYSANPVQVNFTGQMPHTGTPNVGYIHDGTYMFGISIEDTETPTRIFVIYPFTVFNPSTGQQYPNNTVEFNKV